MINSRVCLMVLSVLCVCTVFAQVAPTFTVEIGSFPWHDRVNQWPISQIPDKYVSDKPLPQQSCTDRSLILPEAGAKSVLLGVFAE